MILYFFVECGSNISYRKNIILDELKLSSLIFSLNFVKIYVRIERAKSGRDFSIVPEFNISDHMQHYSSKIKLNEIRDTEVYAIKEVQSPALRQEVRGGGVRPRG